MSPWRSGYKASAVDTLTRRQPPDVITIQASPSVPRGTRLMFRETPTVTGTPCQRDAPTVSRTSRRLFRPIMVWTLLRSILSASTPSGAAK